MMAPGSTRISRAAISTSPTTRPEITTVPAGDVQVVADLARHLHIAARNPRAAADGAAGAHGHGTAGNRRLVGDEARDLDIAAGGPKVVTDTASRLIRPPARITSPSMSPEISALPAARTAAPATDPSIRTSPPAA